MVRVGGEIACCHCREQGRLENTLAQAELMSTEPGLQTVRRLMSDLMDFDDGFTVGETSRSGPGSSVARVTRARWSAADYLRRGIGLIPQRQTARSRRPVGRPRIDDEMLPELKGLGRTVRPRIGSCGRSGRDPPRSQNHPQTVVPAPRTSGRTREYSRDNR
jgi:hypothetical protein